MTRLLMTVALIAALAAGTAWIVDNPGLVTIKFQGYTAHTSFAELVLVVAVLMLVSAFLMRLWRWLRRGYWEHRQMARQRRGYDELAWGLSALMAGDGRRAHKHAQKFEQLVGTTPLADVLAGEAALMQGELGEARSHFKALEDDKRTEALALRGLLAVADRSGDDVEKIHAAKDAAKRLPKAAWAQTSLFETAVAAHAWDDAASALNNAMRAGQLDGDEGRRQLATVRLCQAQEMAVADNGADPTETRRLALEALELNPDLIPARALAADLTRQMGNKRRTANLLKAGWRQNPHPMLVQSWAALEPTETPAQAYRRMVTLTKGNRDHPESHIALGRSALKAGLVGAARGHVQTMIETAPQKRAFMLLAAIEEAASNETAAANARGAIATAGDDPSWHCTHCGHVEDMWVPQCPECGAFAAFTWSALTVSITPPTGLISGPRDIEDSAAPALMAAPHHVQPAQDEPATDEPATPGDPAAPGRDQSG